jgi:hypothetical protein
MAVLIDPKPISSKQLAKALGVSDERYRAIVELADSLAEPRRSSRSSATIDVHVLPAPDGWLVKPSNHRSKDRVFQNKRDAIQAGRDLARSRRKARLVVHASDGSVQQTVDYQSKS